jgi:DNA-binding MarR family transcriptional regulator
MIFEQEPVTRLVGLATGISWKIQRIAERALRAHGLTYAQFGVLTAISEQNGRTQRELAERMESDANNVMVICDSLEKKGLAERRADPADRRIRRIFLTPAGKRTYAKAFSMVESLYRPMIEAFPEKEIIPVFPLLQRVYAYLKEREKA